MNLLRLLGIRDYPFSKCAKFSVCTKWIIPCTYLWLLHQKSCNYFEKQTHMKEIFFKKKLYGPFSWMGFNSLKATKPLRWGSFTFYHEVPTDSWYSFDQPRKDEKLSGRPCSHPAVLNMGPLDWESTALTTR